MEFTSEEIAILKENTRQIVNFIIPFKKDLRKYHTISFGYSQYSTTYEYYIEINPHTIYGGARIKTIALEDNDTRRDYPLDRQPEFMVKLCHEWKTIKQKILSIVEEDKSITNSIRNFEL